MEFMTKIQASTIFAFDLPKKIPAARKNALFEFMSLDSDSNSARRICNTFDFRL